MGISRIDQGKRRGGDQQQDQQEARGEVHGHAITVSPVGSRIARHALYLAAVNAVRRSAEWRALYRRKTAQGKTAKQALIAVAVKWLHTAYAMLKHRVPYDPRRFAAVPTALST